MERFNGGLKAYWKEKAYRRLDATEGKQRRRRRRLPKAELGDGRRRVFWRIRSRIRIAPRLRSLRKVTPKRILAWIRDAYVRLMLAFARSAALGGGYGYSGEAAAMGFSQPMVKEYDEKVLVEIYKSILARGGGIMPVGSATDGQIVVKRDLIAIGPLLLPSRLRGGAHRALKMSGKYILGGLAGSAVIAYLCDVVISDKKIFGGTTPKTISDKEWWEATDKKFQAWPRTAGPPVVMNPISRQNFIVKQPES
ncbi:hypothetical protein J5N97_015372 [Dioscorea zingiberensis]|uniref:Uncharacterized protein n=1 Tax=Dioscorea zingiberensis TaxID=325984 RepID=A0A9D5CWX1_9LILI|nr:hypothetical protein J5N97_015372 [Dioscorea zingiberensis]